MDQHRLNVIVQLERYLKVNHPNAEFTLLHATEKGAHIAF
jgi:hypothetical protein